MFSASWHDSNVPESEVRQNDTVKRWRVQDLTGPRDGPRSSGLVFGRWEANSRSTGCKIVYRIKAIRSKAINHTFPVAGTRGCSALTTRLLVHSGFAESAGETVEDRLHDVL